jgi:NAD(P)-dependent dehydrogenase (short-subunit alcohol dehydrogenase family)
VAAALLGVRALTRHARRMDFGGAVVVVTGGSRGLGLALAREFGRLDARVAICARDPEELLHARDDLLHRGVPVMAVPCDVTRPAELEALMDAVAERWGRIDVLVNNAGIIQVGPVDTMTLEDFQQAMATNFWATLHGTRAVLPIMRSQGGGRIVNIASIGGKVSVPHLLPYSASKFALVGLSEGLRSELGRDGILVTTVCPGLMRTGSPRHATFKGRHRAEYAWFSIADSLPGISMDVARAARQIVRACRDGVAEVVLSAPAKVTARIHALAPGLVAGVLGLANRLLPAPGGVGSRGVPGHASTSALAPSWLTALGDEAARRHNQIPPRSA